MRLAIIGSRTFTDYDKFLEVMFQFDLREQITTIVSGGAVGADALGERYAEDWQISITRYIPTWAKYGKSAGFKRNQHIVDNCDMVLAFWDGRSKGTEDAITKARIAKKTTVIIYV